MVNTTEVTKEFIEEMQQYRKPKDPSMSLFEAAAENPIIFAEKMLGYKLYAWQIDFLWKYKLMIDGELDTKDIAAITSRQIGKSFCLGVASIWSCIFNKYPGTAFNNTVIGIISSGDRNAKELMREVKKLLIAGDVHMKNEHGSSEFFTSLIDKSEQNNTEIITFKAYDKSPHPMFLKGAKAGPQIMSYPPTGKVLGKSFTLIFVDEAARYDEITDEFLKEELLPTGSATSAKRVWTSTPWGPAGHFYYLVNPDGVFPDSGAVVVKYTIDALKMEEHAQPQYEYVMSEIENYRQRGDYQQVQRAYYGEFVKAEKSFFDPDHVDNMFSKDYEMFESYDGLCDIGVDFGGEVASRTVITVSLLSAAGEIYRLYKRVYPVNEDDSLMHDLEHDVMVKFPNWQRIIVDDAPVATYLKREMADKGWDLHLMNFRSEKVKKFGAFRSMLRRGEVFSFKDDDLMKEMKELEANTGSRQSRIVAPRGGSDDLVDSFVMSAYFFALDEGQFSAYSWDDIEEVDIDW